MRKYGYIYLLIFLNLITYHSLIHFSVIQYSDWSFYTSTKLIDAAVPTTWLSSVTLGSVDLSFWKLPLSIAYSIFGYLNFNSNVADLFLVYIPIIFFLFFCG